MIGPRDLGNQVGVAARFLFFRRLVRRLFSSASSRCMIASSSLGRRLLRRGRRERRGRGGRRIARRQRLRRRVRRGIKPGERRRRSRQSLRRRRKRRARQAESMRVDGGSISAPPIAAPTLSITSDRRSRTLASPRRRPAVIRPAPLRPMRDMRILSSALRGCESKDLARERAHAEAQHRPQAQRATTHESCSRDKVRCTTRGDSSWAPDHGTRSAIDRAIGTINIRGTCVTA